jgi:predicted alpha/beta-hydrolase family hydrolase
MSSKSLEVTGESSPISCLQYGEASVNLVFTHGAGGSLSSDAMVNFASGFAAALSSIICFKGSMNLKSRVKSFSAILGDRRSRDCSALGGRSMGARAAVMAAMETTEFLVLVSYPLRSGKGQVRDEILLGLRPEVQVLFISGDGDSMCDLVELDAVRQRMKCKTWLVKVRNADHGMNVKPKRGTKSVGEETGKVAAEWLKSRDTGKTECEIFYDDDEQAAGRIKWEKLRAVAQAVHGSKGDVKVEKKNTVEEEMMIDEKAAKKVMLQEVRSKKRRRTDDATSPPRRSSRLQKIPDK